MIFIILHTDYGEYRKLSRFIEHNLASLAKTSDVIHRNIETRRQRLISVTLGGIGVLAIINAISNFFAFGRWEMSLEVHQVVMEEAVLFCLLLFVIITWFNYTKYDPMEPVRLLYRLLQRRKDK